MYFSEYKKYPIDFYYKTDNFIDKEYINNPLAELN